MRQLGMMAALLLLVAGCGKRAGGHKEAEHKEGEHKEGEHKEGEHKEGEHGEGEHEEHEEGVVELTAEQLANAGLATAKVERRVHAGAMRATAQIEPPADGIARVGSRVEGRVISLKVGAGDPVKKGQLLAVVEASALGSAKADYLASLALANVTRETADREKALFEKKISSERVWREAEANAIKARAEKEAAENRLHALGVSDAQLARLKVEGHYSSTLPIVAPLGGVVVERSVTLGEVVTPANTLFLIMDLSQVWILVDIYEQDLTQIKVGQGAKVAVAAYKGRFFEGKVTSIGAVVEARTRSVKVRVALANPTGELKPGMFASVELEATTGEERSVLAVPVAALQREGDETVVFVPKGERDFEARRVEVGRTLGEFAEVTRGLAEGDLVVTTGSFTLKSELQKSKLGGGHSH